MTHRWQGAVGRFAAWMFVASATAEAEPRRIAFEEAVRIALEHNSSLDRARIALAQDRLSVHEARGRLLPDLRVSVSGSKTYGRAFNEAEGALFTESVESANARLSSSVVLFDGLSNLADLRGAQREAEAAALDLGRARQTVVFDVISAYLALVEATEQVRVQEENLRAQEEQLRSVATLVDAGERPISDLYQQRSNAAQARLALVTARQVEQLRNVDAVQVLRLDPEGDYEFVIPALEPVTGDAPEPDLPALLSRAFERRADLSAQETRLTVARHGEDSAAGARWPSVTLSAGYGSSYSSNRSEPWLDQARDRWSASVGVGVSLPLFDRFVRKGAMERARFGVRSAELEISDLRQAIALQVRRAVLDRDAAREGLRAAEARLRAAEQALSATRDRYEAGAATIYEVGLSRADVVEASSVRVRAQYAVRWQEHLVAYHVGDLDSGSALLR